MARGMNNLQANVCLLAVTLCWSCEVIIFSVIPDGVNPFATTCVTSLIGAMLLGVCFSRRIAAEYRRNSRLLMRRIAALSAMNTAYSVCFLIGLDYFDVSTGAFTVSITAVVLPVMLLVMHRGVGVRTWASAGCVLVVVGNLVEIMPVGSRKEEIEHAPEGKATEIVDGAEPLRLSCATWRLRFPPASGARLPGRP